MGPLLHLDPNVAKKSLLILKSTETTQQPELFTIKLKTKKDDLGAKTLIDDSDVSLTKTKRQSQPSQSEVLDIKLRPVSKRAVLEDEQILKTEDLQQYLDDLSDRLKDMKLKPTQLEPVVKRNLVSKNDEKIIDKAVKAAQKATQQKAPSKTTGKHKQAEVFVDTLFKEMPKDLPSNTIDKQAIIRKVSLIPSLDSLSASDEKQIASIISSAKDALTQPKITRALSSS